MSHVKGVARVNNSRFRNKDIATTLAMNTNFPAIKHCHKVEPGVGLVITAHIPHANPQIAHGTAILRSGGWT